MRILAAIDLSTDSNEWLVARAINFTRVLGGRLDLLHVSADPAHLKRLERLLPLIPEELRGRAEVVPGEVLDVLEERSKTVQALVVGPREPPGLARFVLSPMAVRVLLRAHCAVYIPRTDRFGDRPVEMVVGVDLAGDRRYHVIKWASQWAERLDATLDLVHALPRSLPAMRRPEWRQAAEQEWEARHAEEREGLDSLMLLVSEAHRGQVHLAHGEPTDALVAVSEHYDLLLVGNKERAGLARYLVGSVANHIVRESKCDVLTLPTAYVDGPA